MLSLTSRFSLSVACLAAVSFPTMAAFTLPGALTPPPQNATVTFHVQDTGVLGQQTSVTLAVAKPGRMPIVLGQPAAGEINGVHVFASSDTGAGISQFYADLLQGSGWIQGVDFLRSGNSIHFYGIGAIASDCNHRQLHVGLSVGLH